jgi:hypothetical protein
VFTDPTTSESLRVINAPIALNDDEARQLAIDDGIREFGSHLRDWGVAVDAYWMKPSKLEHAVREVLGWNPPTES